MRLSLPRYDHAPFPLEPPPGLYVHPVDSLMVNSTGRSLLVSKIWEGGEKPLRGTRSKSTSRKWFRISGKTRRRRSVVKNGRCVNLPERELDELNEISDEQSLLSLFTIRRNTRHRWGTLSEPRSPYHKRRGIGPRSLPWNARACSVESYISADYL